MTDTLDQFRAEIAGYASQDSPPARLMARLADVLERVEASQARIEALPLANVDRLLLGAASKALLTAAPGVERVRRWQRWSAVVAASVVCLCAVVSVWVVVARAPQLAVVGEMKCSGEGCWVWVWNKPPAGK